MPKNIYGIPNDDAIPGDLTFPAEWGEETPLLVESKVVAVA